MSYGVCRIEKYQMKSVKEIEYHNTRNSIMFRNTGKFQSSIKKRLDYAYKGRRNIRKDAVVLCECVVTSDVAFFERIGKDSTEQFFKVAYRWVSERYGEDNIIGAYVHMNESKPHIHIDFVPLTADGRLCAKELIGTRENLLKLQNSFYECVARNFGLDRGKIGLGSKSKHLDSQTYKIKKNQEIIAKQEKLIENYSRLLENREKILNRDDKDGIMELRQQASAVPLLLERLKQEEKKNIVLQNRLEQFNELSVVRELEAVKEERETYRRDFMDLLFVFQNYYPEIYEALLKADNGLIENILKSRT